MTHFDHEFANRCACESSGPVALTLRQKLLPVEGADAVIFPPTYATNASIPYNIDTLSDGTKIAMIDSVGAQANRMEPLFKATANGTDQSPYASLVPQVTITYGDNNSISLLDVGHRLGDALIRSTELAEEVNSTFNDYLKSGDVSAIAKLAPTSLVFGVWDSRNTQAKLPRIVQSVIRAWNVDTLRRSAQYNPPVNYTDLQVFSEAEKKKGEGNQKSPLAQRGFVSVPATNEHGGILVHGEIRRDITINLVALRRLNGEHCSELRHYILGLALVSATAPLDSFLRQGCLITPDPDVPAVWTSVARNGKREELILDEEKALSFAKDAASSFERAYGVKLGEEQKFSFDKQLAKADANKKKD